MVAAVVDALDVALGAGGLAIAGGVDVAAAGQQQAVEAVVERAQGGRVVEEGQEHGEAAGRGDSTGIALVLAEGGRPLALRHERGASDADEAAGCGLGAEYRGASPLITQDSAFSTNQM